METFVRRAGRLTWVGLAIVFLGVSVVIVYAWIEYLNDPAISPVDGYWIGREPWISIGVGLALAGSAVALLSAAMLVLVRGDWLRRLLVLPVVAASAYWWLTAMSIIPMPRYYPRVEPVTLAYSLPEAAAIFLIVPAIAAALLAFLPMQPDRRVRLRPVHDSPERSGGEQPPA